MTWATADFEVLPQHHTVRCTATAEPTGPTGVEMEALTGVLMPEKRGGKSGVFVAG